MSRLILALRTRAAAAWGLCWWSGRGGGSTTALFGDV